MLRFELTAEPPLEGSNQRSEVSSRAGPSRRPVSPRPHDRSQTALPQITTWFHLRPRRKAKPHLAVKEYRRGSSLPEHNQTGEGGCLIKIEHLALGFCLGNRLRMGLDLRALRKVRRPRRPSYIVRPRKPEIWQNEELILTVFRKVQELGNHTAIYVRSRSACLC